MTDIGQEQTFHMRLFDAAALSALKTELVGKWVDSILLATYDMVIGVADISILCSETVTARIGGADYAWEDAPSGAPWGQLVRQIVADVELPSPDCLRLLMESGDYLDIYTVVGHLESVVVRYPSPADEFLIDVY